MSSLKEIAENLRAKFNEIESFPEVIIPVSLKKEIGDLIQNRNSTKAAFNENSFYVETSPKHYAIIPNQYFYLAVECYDLVVRLRYLFDFFDNVFRTNDELKRKVNLIQEKISKDEQIDVTLELKDVDFSLFTNVTVEDFSYLIGNLKDCKKFGNFEKNTLRTSEDLLGAYVLNIVPLTTAASGYFGTLVYVLSSDLIVYKKLCDSIKYTYVEKNNSENPSSYTQNFSQIIYYGVPGSGKSHKIDHEIKDKIKNKEDREKQVLRVVFHPEYTNADFVGQILPVQTNKGLEYPFKAGPFTRILKRALKNPDKPYYLIIEEINRGNAAAIFGELFQVLDRNSDGWSSYSIENLDINAFIRSEDERYSEKEPPKTKKVGNIEVNENTSLRLPPNLSLLATMNTSDQNVFTLDNAFQRRWDMRLVENQFDDKDENSKIQRTAEIGGTNVTWEQFQTHINKRIGEMSSSIGMSSMEDKRLGCWFVKAEDGKISKEQFAEKVLKYLWDDAFKFSREEIFDIRDKTSSLESIVSDFKNGDESAPCNWTIFKDTSFISQKDNVQAESDAGETE